MDEDLDLGVSPKEADLDCFITKRIKIDLINSDYGAAGRINIAILATCTRGNRQERYIKH
jgi:hypothetical protein